MIFSSQLRQFPQMIITLDKYTVYMFTSLPNCMMSSSVAMEILCITNIGSISSVKYFTDRSKAVLLLWIFYVFVLSCVCYVLCASVYMCFVVTCWERADLFALVCGVFCEFVTFPLVSWVRCGT